MSSDSMRLLVTGATGFVGRCLVERAAGQPGRIVTAALRSTKASGLPLAQQFVVGEINASTRWNEAVKNVDTVVHLAGRAHVMHETASDPLEAYRELNVRGTLHLARSAALAGVNRMIFMSSVKVNGEGFPSGSPLSAFRPYRESDRPAPQDAYGISKHEAELRLREVALETGMEVVIIRPPLVYGAGVRANMLALIKAVARGIPLPLAAVANCRSLIYKENLADFILCCADAGSAANETFLVGDGTDFSTPELIRRMAAAMGRPARLFAVPSGLLRWGARLAGIEAQAQRLLGSLQVDNAKARTLLAWRPPVSVDLAFERTVAAFRSKK